MNYLKYKSVFCLGFIIFITYTILKILSSYILNEINPFLLKVNLYLIVTILFVYLNFRYNSLKIVHLTNFKIKNIKLLVLPCLLFITYFLLNTQFRNLEKLSKQVVLNTFVATFLPVLFEEILFRYFSLNFLLSRNVSIKRAGLFSSFLFALLHLINISHSNYISVLNQSFLAFFFGLLLFTVVQSTNFFYMSIFMHLLMNLSNAINGLNDVNTGDTTITLLGAIFSFVSINVVFLPFTFLAVWNFKRIPNSV